MANATTMCNCCMSTNEKLTVNATYQSSRVKVPYVHRLKIIYPDMKCIQELESITLCRPCLRQLTNAYNMRQALYKTSKEIGKKSPNADGDLEMVCFCRCCFATLTFLMKDKDEFDCANQIKSCFGDFAEKESLLDPEGMVVFCNECRTKLDIFWRLKETLLATLAIIKDVKGHIEQITIDETIVKVETVEATDGQQTIVEEKAIKIEKSDEIVAEEGIVKMEATSERETSQSVDFSSLVDPVTYAYAFDNQQTLPYKCKYCEKEFELNFNLTSHMRGSFTEKSVNCKYCRKLYSQKCQRRRCEQMHLNRFNAKPFKCQYCGSLYSLKSELEMHENEHVVRPFKCKKCFRGFIQRGELLIHEKERHGKAPTNVCHYCYKTFRTKIELDAHNKVHVGEGIAEFKCRFCEWTFADESLWQSHERYHQQIGRFPCKFCAKIFRHVDFFKQHEHSQHIGEHHICRYCNMQFDGAAPLDTHEAFHTVDGAVEHKCSKCNQGFASSKELRSHESAGVQSGYRCPRCCECFATTCSLQVHLRSHDAAPKRKKGNKCKNKLSEEAALAHQVHEARHPIVKD